MEQKRESQAKTKRMSNKKIDKEKLNESANKIHSNEVMKNAKGFLKGLQDICNRSMPKRET